MAAEVQPPHDMQDLELIKGYYEAMSQKVKQLEERIEQLEDEVTELQNLIQV